MKVKTHIKAGLNVGVVGVGNIIGQNSGTATGVGILVTPAPNNG